MTLIALSVLILSAMANAFLGFAVLLRTYQKVYGFYFGLCLLGVVLWAAADAGLLFSSNPRLVSLSAEVFYIAPMMIPIFIWFFALTFPEDHKLPKAALVAGSTAFIAFSLLFLFDFGFFIHDISIQRPFNISTPSAPGFLLYAFYLSFFFALTYLAFFAKIRKLRGLARTQVVYTFWGTTAASLPALIANLSLPLLGVRHLIWIGPVFTLIFTASVTVAIIRHRLFNIQLVFARTVGYILSVASLAAMYGALAFAILNKLVFRGQPISFMQQLAYTLLAASLAFTFNPARRFFEKITNRLFYRDAYDPQSLIDQLNRSLVANVDLDSMLHEVSEVVQANLKTEFCTFAVNMQGKLEMIGSEEKDFSKSYMEIVQVLFDRDKDRVIVLDALYPSHTDDKPLKVMNDNNVGLLANLIPDGNHNKTSLGCMILGSKKSGNPFTGGDVKIINIIINELVIAIENALRFKEIEDFNITLQERVLEATRKLRRTNDKLRLLDQTKDDFISMSSHQLRTPLTSVKGYVSMVLDGDAGKISPLQRKLLNQAFISSQRMVYLISDLLNVSRLRTGKFIIEPVPTNLATVVKEEMAQLMETAKARELTLAFNHPDRFPTVLLDETKMRQVIMNFIDNAIYYTPSGGHITVDLVDRPTSIELTVTDDGIGVPRSEQFHLFGKFYRAPNAKRMRPDGTGLGLFMAKKVVIAQGGSIIFKSQEGKGSTFGFTFSKEKLNRQTPISVS